MPLHRRFVCKDCKRRISGCAPSCKADHVVEEVECCAFCSKFGDERGPATKSRRIPDESAETDVAEQQTLKKLAAGELW